MHTHTHTRVVKRKDSGWRLTLPLSFARTLMLKTIIFAWKQGHAFDAPSHCMQKIIASRSAHSAQYANSNCTAHSAQSLLRSVRSHTHTHTCPTCCSTWTDAWRCTTTLGFARARALSRSSQPLSPLSPPVSRSVRPPAAQSAREKPHTVASSVTPTCLPRRPLCSSPSTLLLLDRSEQHSRC